MNELLEQVLNNASSRVDLPALAADQADKFLPWASLEGM